MNNSNNNDIQSGHDMYSILTFYLAMMNAYNKSLAVQ